MGALGVFRWENSTGGREKTMPLVSPIQTPLSSGGLLEAASQLSLHRDDIGRAGHAIPRRGGLIYQLLPMN